MPGTENGKPFFAVQSGQNGESARLQDELAEIEGWSFVVNAEDNLAGWH
jgi:hypothetical protein